MLYAGMPCRCCVDQGGGAGGGGGRPGAAPTQHPAAAGPSSATGQADAHGAAGTLTIVHESCTILCRRIDSCEGVVGFYVPPNGMQNGLPITDSP